MDDLISRQAAIDEIRKCRFVVDAIEKIRGLPTAQPEKVCIANITLSEEQLREAVEKAKNEVVHVLPSAQPDLDEWCTDCSEYDQERHCCPRWNRVIRQTLKDAQPTADVRENVRGEWIEDNPRDKSMMWRCSVCGRIAYYPTIGERKSYKKHCGYNYCPNCGADMRGDKT